MRYALTFALALAGCAGGNRGDLADLATAAQQDLATMQPHDDGAASAAVVVNEVDPNGPDVVLDPDWAELKNVGAAQVDLTGWGVRDSKAADLTALPPGTKIAAGGYLVVLCDDNPDGGASDAIHVPFKLSGSKGDEFHLVAPDGHDADVATWAANAVPDGKSWARIPDGTGAFTVATLTKDMPNQP